MQKTLKTVAVCKLKDKELLSLIDGFTYGWLSFKALYIHLDVHCGPKMVNYSIRGVCRGLGHGSQAFIWQIRQLSMFDVPHPSNAEWKVDSVQNNYFNVRRTNFWKINGTTQSWKIYIIKQKMCKIPTTWGFNKYMDNVCQATSFLYRSHSLDFRFPLFFPPWAAQLELKLFTRGASQWLLTFPNILCLYVYLFQVYANSLHNQWIGQ